MPQAAADSGQADEPAAAPRVGLAPRNRSRRRRARCSPCGWPGVWRGGRWRNRASCGRASAARRRPGTPWRRSRHRAASMSQREGERRLRPGRRCGCGRSRYGRWCWAPCRTARGRRRRRRTPRNWAWIAGSVKSPSRNVAPGTGSIGSRSTPITVGAALDRDLRPAARRRAQVDDPAAAAQQAELVVELHQLERGARAQALLLRGADIGVVQLPLQPFLRRGGAAARGAQLDGQAARTRRLLGHRVRPAGGGAHRRRASGRRLRLRDWRIIRSSMPSRRPRSATVTSAIGQVWRIASNTAQPGSTNSTRSGPTQGCAASPAGPRSRKVGERLVGRLACSARVPSTSGRR